MDVDGGGKRTARPDGSQRLAIRDRRESWRAGFKQKCKDRIAERRYNKILSNRMTSEPCTGNSSEKKNLQQLLAEQELDRRAFMDIQTNELSANSCNADEYEEDRLAELALEILEEQRREYKARTANQSPDFEDMDDFSHMEHIDEILDSMESKGYAEYGKV